MAPKKHSGRRKSGGKVQAPAQATVTIPQAKTIEEANQLAVSLGVAGYADFTDIDISVANEMIQVMVETQRLIPNLGGLFMYGGHEAVQKRVRGRFYDPFPAGLYYWGNNAISLNHFRYSTRELPQTIEREKLLEEIGFHPKGAGSIRGIISHEIGHAIDYKFKAYRDPSIQALFNRYSDGTGSTENRPGGVNPVPTKMMQALSSYANFEIREFIAEAWTEYRNNPKPRPLAKQVGDRIMEIARGRNS